MPSENISTAKSGTKKVVPRRGGSLHPNFFTCTTSAEATAQFRAPISPAILKYGLLQDKFHVDLGVPDHLVEHMQPVAQSGIWDERVGQAGRRLSVCLSTTVTT